MTKKEMDLHQQNRFSIKINKIQKGSYFSKG